MFSLKTNLKDHSGAALKKANKKTNQKTSKNGIDFSKDFFKVLLKPCFFSFLISSTALAALPPKDESPRYKVNMRVNLKGSSPLSVNTVTKSGKKAYVSQFSDDGQVETLVAVTARRSQQNETKGLYLDVQVTKRVRGESKLTERAQFFAPENKEMEVGANSHGRMAGNLSLAVMAHQL